MHGYGSVSIYGQYTGKNSCRLPEFSAMPARMGTDKTGSIIFHIVIFHNIP